MLLSSTVLPPAACHGVSEGAPAACHGVSEGLFCSAKHLQSVEEAAFLSAYAWQLSRVIGTMIVDRVLTCSIPTPVLACRIAAGAAVS